MRRKDREITDLEEILSIIDRAAFLTLALSDEEGPYSLPINYGYEEADGKITFYIHSAMEGRKLAALRSGRKLSLSIALFDGYICSGEEKSWTSFFESFIGFGWAEELLDHDRKAKAMNTLMKKASGREHAFPEGSLNGTAVFAIHVDSYSAKRKKD